MSSHPKFLFQSDCDSRGKLLEGEVTTRSTLGTKTKSQILKELSIQLGRPCRLDELLQHMCTNPKTGQPYPTRHTRILEKYCEVMVTKFDEDREKWPVFDKDAWVQASGGVQKGDQWTGVPLEFSNPDAFTSAAMTSQVNMIVYAY
ncbi:unnamed protein product [Cuscuta campestris]|uniref:Uncharacterized protein n=1 Tax=Cuscuta campestris TaxID=132261 RepID=A0A484L837_9ASTE|nr:unnamed protein product [Cuscuta campestris]